MEYILSCILITYRIKKAQHFGGMLQHYRFKPDSWSYRFILLFMNTSCISISPQTYGVLNVTNPVTAFYHYIQKRQNSSSFFATEYDPDWIRFCSRPIKNLISIQVNLFRWHQIWWQINRRVSGTSRLQRQKAETAYLGSKQLIPFGFVERDTWGSFCAAEKSIRQFWQANKGNRRFGAKGSYLTLVRVADRIL